MESLAIPKEKSINRKHLYIESINRKYRLVWLQCSQLLEIHIWTHQEGYLAI